MLTLRRNLKYLPAVVLGLLAVAWLLSWTATLGYCSKRSGWAVLIADSNLGLVYVPNGPNWDGWFATPRLSERIALQAVTGSARLFRAAKDPRNASPGEPLLSVHIPLPGLVTAVFPLAIGPFLSFRFRLWHYLAYTALVALELAFYLR